jgi:hypothetical protein
MGWNSRSRLNFACALNKFTHTHIHIHTKVITLSFSPSPPPWEKCLTCGTPLGGSREWIKLPFCPVGQNLTEDLWNSSRRFLGVDQAPLPSSGTGPDLGLISLGVVLTESRRDGQMSWSTSPWSPSWVKAAQRVGAPRWRRTQNTIGWRTTSFSPVSLPTLMQPSRQLVAQGASGLESRWGLHLLWQYSQRRNQATLRGVENSDFNFYASGPRRVPVSEPQTKDSQDI